MAGIRKKLLKNDAWPKQARRELPPAPTLVSLGFRSEAVNFSVNGKFFLLIAKKK